MDNWTVSDVGHAGVIGQYLAIAEFSTLFFLTGSLRKYVNLSQP